MNTFLVNILLSLLVYSNHIENCYSRNLKNIDYTTESADLSTTHLFDTTTGEPHTTTTVLGGCNAQNCLNGGECDSKGECQCAPGFYGPTCSQDFTTEEPTSTNCNALNCLNGGHCDIDGQCVCAEGFYGPTCSDTEDSITHEPDTGCNAANCLNGGTCDSNNNCICANGFSGPSCSIHHTTTTPIPLPGCNNGGDESCQNGGSCNANGTCTCVHGYWGDKCADYIGCAALGSLACQNDGICTNEGNCICSSGFTGNQCETQIGFQGCTSHEMCLNGGSCALNGICVCKIGYNGSKCENYIGCHAGDCLTCSNDGICSQNGTCICKIGFTGPQCSIYIGCHANGILTCQNGATCSNAHCECLSGFSGLTCEIGCESGGDKACLNGGVCGINKTCICSDGYMGSTCAIFIGCNDKRGCLTCLNSGTCQINGFCACKPGYTDKICSTYVGLNYIMNTVILTQSEISNVYSMVGLRTLTLLYRATRDGFTAAAFHAKCDGKAKTITIIKTINNYVFGGYTSAIWNPTGYKSDSSAYIFSLRRGSVSVLNVFGFRSYSGSYYQNAIYAHTNYGPTFGGGHDIYIRDRSDVNAGSYTAPSSFNIPSNTYLAGTYNTWYTAEIEVFQI